MKSIWLVGFVSQNPNPTSQVLFFIIYFYTMKSDLNVCELMQLILDWMEEDNDFHDLPRVYYWKAIKDLAKLIWEDPDRFWIN